MPSKTRVVQQPYQNTTTATFDHKALPGIDGAQAVQDFKNAPVYADPSWQQARDVRDQSSENAWNNDFVSGLPYHLRMQMQQADKRQNNMMADYNRQNAEYMASNQDLAKKQALLPQLVQTGGTSQGYQSQVIQQPSIWSSILGAGATIGGALLSDERLKNVQGPSSVGLEEIEQLQPTSYTGKPGTPIDDGKQHEGLLAQEVEQVIPQAVGQSAEGIKDIQIEPILAGLVNAVKELKEQVDMLRGTPSPSPLPRLTGGQRNA